MKRKWEVAFLFSWFALLQCWIIAGSEASGDVKEDGPVHWSFGRRIQEGLNREALDVQHFMMGSDEGPI